MIAARQAMVAFEAAVAQLGSTAVRPFTYQGRPYQRGDAFPHPDDRADGAMIARLISTRHIRLGGPATPNPTGDTP